MKAVIQRVSRAKVTVCGRITGEIARGIVLLAACHKDDAESDFRWIAEKTSNIRIFPGDTFGGGGHFDKSVKEIGGSILAVSQFTLLGDARKGRRPSFAGAMPVDRAKEAFGQFITILRETGVPIETGEFQAMMDVELVNDGPVTIIIDSKER